MCPLNLDILSKLLESASCGAYAVSIDQTIVLWNRNAERILGHSSQNVLGRKCYEVMEGVTSIGLTPQCLGGCPSMHYLRAGLIPATGTASNAMFHRGTQMGVPHSHGGCRYP